MGALNEERLQALKVGIHLILTEVGRDVIPQIGGLIKWSKQRQHNWSNKNTFSNICIFLRKKNRKTLNAEVKCKVRALKT